MIINKELMARERGQGHPLKILILFISLFNMYIFLPSQRKDFNV